MLNVAAGLLAGGLMPEPPMNLVVCCGVNDVDNAEPLKSAETDAQDVFECLTGGLGPPFTGGVLLLGANANVNALFTSVAQFLGRNGRPQYLAFYFSGHGNTVGLAMSDKLLHYERLAQLVRSVGARSTLIVLDTCHAAAYGQHVHPGELAGISVTGGLADDLLWLRALQQAQPGVRIMFSTNMHTSSREDPELRNGVFTTGLLRTLRCAAGSIASGPLRFVSDLQAFSGAAHYVHQHQAGQPAFEDGPQAPQFMGRLGDFPLVRSQAFSPVGDVEIERLELVSDFDPLATFTVRGRKHVLTRWHCQLAHLDGQEIASDTAIFRPRGNPFRVAKKPTFVVQELLADERALRVLRTGKRLAVLWRFRLLDAAHGHLLAEESVSCTYWHTHPQVMRTGYEGQYR